MSFLIVFTEYCIACLTGLALVLQLSSATNIIDGGLKLNSSEKSPTFVKIDNFAENGTIYQRTKKSCNETQTCKHGGSCLKHACVCLPGTSGELCEIIDDCVKGTLCHLNRETTCEYSVEKQRAYCECHVMEWRFDDASKTCQDCLCTPWGHQDLTSFSNCEFHQGQQICSCTEGFSYNPSRQVCLSCDCGKHSTWCGFNTEGRKMCSCKEGYVQYYDGCTKCECGKHGICAFSYSALEFKNCDCDHGYEEYNRTCVECSCGTYGNCIFDSKGKQIGCNCIAGYAEKLGKCEMCFCGDNSNCSYTGSEKSCECEIGFKEVSGFCFDINECKNHEFCLNGSEKCVNTFGSYKCICNTGYKFNDFTELCEDTDECLNSSACSEPNSDCVNFDGGFACICKVGFVSRGGINSYILCEETSTQTIYVIVIAFTVVALIVSFFLWMDSQKRYFQFIYMFLVRGWR